MQKDFIAILWQHKYYGLPKYGHHTCAREATQGTYITDLPLFTKVCAKCGLALLQPQDNERQP
jgi:hypothetical protein